MTTRKSSAWLALPMAFLMALPLVAMADDTELFTTRANPNVLLMIDTTGSMDTQDSLVNDVGDLDGDGTSNTRMDILWKVVYTLLNGDRSVPGASVTLNTTTSSTYNTNTTYSQIRVNCGNDYPFFPSTGGTIFVGSGSNVDNVNYANTSTSFGSCYFNFSPGKKFKYSHSNPSTVSYSDVPGLPYPVNHPEASSTSFLNNLTTTDQSTLKARIGLMTFTTNSDASVVQTIIRNQVPSNAPNDPTLLSSPIRYQDIWSSIVSYANPLGGTPTAKALRKAAGFFDTAYNSSEICRKNFAVMITDGEDTMGGLDGATGNGYGPDYFCGGSFNPDGWSCGYNTGQVSRHNAVIQESANLLSHSPSINLYTVGVGINGNRQDLAVQREVLRRAAEQANAQATTSQYRTIGASGDNTSRAANEAFFATDSTELAAALTNIFSQISAGTFSFTAPTVASVRMSDRNYLYLASFKPALPPATFWEGSLKAYTLNSDNTMTLLWDDNTILRDTAASARRIYAGYTDNTSWSRLDFTISAITPAMLTVDNTAVRDNVVNYIRGEGRTTKLGDIFHSKPVVVGPPSRFFFDDGYSTAVGATQSFVESKAHRKRVVYVGTNDGMLHAFLSGTYNTSAGLYDGGTGEELFGYIPYNLLDNLENFVPGLVTSHGYYVDSSPRIADVWIDSNHDGVKQTSEWRTVLIGGLRKGGNGYFALDITDPPDGTDYSNYPKLLWEYANASNIGETWSEPFIGKVKTKATSSSTVLKDRWVAIFGGGRSDAGTIGASLVVLDIATGLPLKTFTTGIDNVIPASPTAVLDASGYIKFVYATDLDGTLYKFDFRTPGVDNAYSAWTFSRIFQASAGQPAYNRIESSSIDENNRWLFFGTGDREKPVTNTGTGKFYAIKDADTDNTLHTESNLANLSTSITSLSGGTVGSTQYGWFISFASVPSTANDTFPHAGEKVLSDPVVFFNNVYFTTYTPDTATANPCSGGGTSRVYGLQMLNAGAALSPLASLGETSTTMVPYHVYGGRGIPSSPSLSINPAGQSSIFVGFSTGSNPIEQISVSSPSQSKTIKSWREIF
jgi:type IV pilus assembly protein PilY1